MNESICNYDYRSTLKRKAIPLRKEKIEEWERFGSINMKNWINS